MKKPTADQRRPSASDGEMATRKIILLLLMITAIVFVCSCTKDRTGGPDKQHMEKPGQQSGEEMQNGGLINVIRNGKLVNFQMITIGNAFDSYMYLTKKAWKQTSLKSGHITVEFTGWFEPVTLNDTDKKNGIAGRGLEVMFVVNPDGSYYVFMVSMIESKADGSVDRHQLNDIAGTLAKIYANTKIDL